MWSQPVWKYFQVAMMSSIDKFYFFYQFNAEKEPFMPHRVNGTKTNFQSQSIKASKSTSSPFETPSFFLMSITKFLNQTTAPSHNTIVKTTLSWSPWCSFISPPWYLFLLFLFSLSSQSLLGWSMSYQATFSSIFPINPAHTPILGAVLTGSIFYIWPSQKKAGRGVLGQYL